MQMWVATYYVGGRFGSMLERQHRLPSDLTTEDARRQVQRYLDRLTAKGTAVFPQFDLQLENVA